MTEFGEDTIVLGVRLPKSLDIALSRFADEDDKPKARLIRAVLGAYARDRVAKTAKRGRA